MVEVLERVDRRVEPVKTTKQIPLYKLADVQLLAMAPTQELYKSFLVGKRCSLGGLVGALISNKQIGSEHIVIDSDIKTGTKIGSLNIEALRDTEYFKKNQAMLEVLEGYHFSRRSRCYKEAVAIQTREAEAAVAEAEQVVLQAARRSFTMSIRAGIRKGGKALSLAVLALLGSFTPALAQGTIPTLPQPPTPTSTESATPTRTPTPTATQTETSTATNTSTATATATASSTATATETSTATATQTETSTATATATTKASETATASITATITALATAIATRFSTATTAPTQEATAPAQVEQPQNTPTVGPTAKPSPKPAPTARAQTTPSPRPVISPSPPPLPTQVLEIRQIIPKTDTEKALVERASNIQMPAEISRIIAVLVSTSPAAANIVLTTVEGFQSFTNTLPSPQVMVAVLARANTEIADLAAKGEATPEKIKHIINYAAAETALKQDDRFNTLSPALLNAVVSLGIEGEKVDEETRETVEEIFFIINQFRQRTGVEIEPLRLVNLMGAYLSNVADISDPVLRRILLEQTAFSSSESF
ncbi:hypothetical protein HYW41_04715 [Candidatus Daviesbacteria bacterium]|nr:hypothetical protein [Candidatus Daviesbacteria bacterium]